MNGILGSPRATSRWPLPWTVQTSQGAFCPHYSSRARAWLEVNILSSLRGRRHRRAVPGGAWRSWPSTSELSRKSKTHGSHSSIMVVGDAKTRPALETMGGSLLMNPGCAAIIALCALGHKEITMADQTWTWPAGRVLVLYHWSWFDPSEGDVIVGWSQRGETDDAGYIHLEAEDFQPARTLQTASDYVIVKQHTLSPLTPLPDELTDDTGAPLPWVRALIGG